MHSPEIQQFIHEQRALFWYIREDKKTEISLEHLVETILIYGDVPEIRKLIQLIGMKKVAGIFHRQTSRPRNNYPERTMNFFSLFFAKYA